MKNAAKKTPATGTTIRLGDAEIALKNLQAATEELATEVMSLASGVSLSVKKLALYIDDVSRLMIIKIKGDDERVNVSDIKTGKMYMKQTLDQVMAFIFAAVVAEQTCNIVTG